MTPHELTIPRPRPEAAIAGALGLATLIAALVALDPWQCNVVSYRLEPGPGIFYLPTVLFAGLLVLLTALLAWWAPGRLTTGLRLQTALAGLWPLLLNIPLAGYLLTDAAPPFGLTLLLVLSAGWATHQATIVLRPGPEPAWLHPVSLGLIVLSLIALTVVHTRLQIVFFEHFMYGHADIGHYTEELKNALAGRGLRSDSFENTRLGWHFSPLLYVLVPGYALWPAPHYLMVCGALFVHLPALAAYMLARRLSGSATVGLMFALAWLLLPSVSRLIYSNTYGFQWVYIAMPLIAVLVAATVEGRWRLFWIVIGLLLLTIETVASAVFGWGLYLLLFPARRRLGALVMVVAVGWFLLCTYLVIPHFAASGRYERMELFGTLGATFGELIASVFTRPGEVLARLGRPESLMYLLILTVPLAWLPFRGWRMSLAALPTLGPILLLENQEWLSIKFWHQATVLPVLFFAGLCTVQPSGQPKAPPPGRVRPPAHALGAAMLVCAAWGHYFYGFSPLSRSYEVQAAAEFLHQPDPRLAVVRHLRETIPRDRTLMVTERLAAHFTDYHRLYTGKRDKTADFVIIDRRDGWDTSDLPRRTAEFGEHPDYRLFGEFGSIVVFERHPLTAPNGTDVDD